MTLYAITTLLTELVSNNASVVILVPVPISIAHALNLAPFPLVLAVMFAASTSFLSPVGYQTNTMIYGRRLPLHPGTIQRTITGGNHVCIVIDNINWQPGQARW